MNFFYFMVYVILGPIFWLIFPCLFYGLKNIPKEGPLMVCANHNAMRDPIFIAMAFGPVNQLSFMVKAELFNIPVIGRLFKLAGMFPANRDNVDSQAIRTTITLLKSGKKIMLFPEGARVERNTRPPAKHGAVKVATKLDVPILPIYIFPAERAFQFSRLVVGEPIRLKQPEDRNFDSISQTLMDEIYSLEVYSRRRKS